MPYNTQNAKPASFLQQQYWLNQRMHPLTPAYNISYVWKVSDNLNVNAFIKAVQGVVNTFDAFRTQYKFENQILNQAIFEKVDFIVEYCPLTYDKIDSHFKEFINRPYNLANDLPIRVSLVKISDNEYYFSVVIHHVSTDLFTWYKFSETLSKYYKQCTEGKELILDIPDYQYSNYCERYQQVSSSEEIDKKLAFWKKYLKDLPTNVDFPADKKRPKVFSNEGARKYFRLPFQQTQALKQFSEDEYIVLFTNLLTAYALLIYRYSKQTRFAIGVPFTNRRMAEDQGVAGCFVNILPVIVDIDPEMPLKKLRSRIQKAMTEVNRYQDVPYLQILNNLNVQFDPQFVPLFQFGFTYEPAIEISLDGTKVHYISDVEGKEGSKMDMFLHLREFEGQLEGYFEYCTSVFIENTASRFAENFKFVLENLSDAIEVPVAKVDIISAAEKNILLHEWNNTKSIYESEVGITAMFEKQVALTPNNIALVFDGGQLTYKEFNDRVNQLANYLLKLAIGPEERIGIYIDRSADMVIAIYAVLKVGGAYVPLDPNNPVDRLQLIIDDSEIKLLLTVDALSEQFSPPQCQKIKLDTDWSEIARESSENPPVKVAPTNLAYLIYTSGSTGKPKGVMIENHSVINFINWRQKEYLLQSHETVLLKTPITFDISVLELFWPLFYGAKLGILTAGAEKFPDQIIETVKNFNVTFMQFVPSMLNVFLEFVNNQTLPKLTSLRFVSTIGEALSAETVNKYNSLLYKINKTRLINTYGPTETTVEVSYFECTSDEPLQIVPIGKPMDNTGFYIVDEHMSLQPIGVIGELLIAGAGMARGYFKRPELTAERFIDNIFDPSLGLKLYHSGDLARFLPSGDIDFLGRMDFQVKIRGYRIELGEIESLIRKHENVADTVVEAKDFMGGEKAIIAYIVPKESISPEKLSEEIFALLHRQLPDYMVPASVMVLKEFPLLTNGKLNRKALPVPEMTAKPLTEVVLPKSETEREILEIWKDVLNTNSISIGDNFFNIGGNSILLIQVATKIQKKFNIEVEVVKLFEYPTIGSFSTFLTLKQKNENIEVENAMDGRVHRMKSAMEKQRDRRRQ